MSKVGKNPTEGVPKEGDRTTTPIFEAYIKYTRAEMEARLGPARSPAQLHG
jgi:hypothetical protein